MERRDHGRVKIWFPVTVFTDEGQEGAAITLDVSPSGLLLASAGKLATGTLITLRITAPAEQSAEGHRDLRGRVVRVQEQEGVDGPWRFRMAIRFDEKQPELESQLSSWGEAH